MPWSKFLKAHWEAIAAADFFTVEVWTAVGLVRYLVFFVLDLGTRRVEIAGIAPVRLIEREPLSCSGPIACH